mgnify:FL=1
MYINEIGTKENSYYILIEDGNLYIENCLTEYWNLEEYFELEMLLEESV